MANTGTAGTTPGAGSATQPQNPLAGMGEIDLERMIQAAAQRLMEQQAEAAAEAARLEEDGPKPPPALKVYVCDRYPNAQIPELDFSKPEPRKHPMRGKTIKFRLGKFRATTENQVKQLDWMMDNPTHDQFGEVIGGFPYIVEDIGESVYICRKCDPNFVTTDPKRFRMHNKTMHSVVSLED
jgi:hypothetical protein